MSKRRRLIGFRLLLMMLLLPTSGIAAPGSETPYSLTEKVLDHLLELMSAFIDGRGVADPWGSPTEANDGDLGFGH